MSSYHGCSLVPLNPISSNGSRAVPGKRGPMLGTSPFGAPLHLDTLV